MATRVLAPNVNGRNTSAVSVRHSLYNTDLRVGGGLLPTMEDGLVLPGSRSLT